MIIQRVLEATSGGIERLAAELGLHYNTVWSWKEGRRRPSSENLRRLAAALERRGTELHALADDLRRHADQQDRE